MPASHELLRLNRTKIVAGRRVRGGLLAWQQKRVADFIDEHLTEHISLVALAELADLSLYHFARSFTQSFGAPPHRYHMARRIDRARNLLRITALTVTQIGSRLGFCDASSFTRAFRKFTGLTPTEYRRRQRHCASQAHGKQQCAPFSLSSRPIQNWLRHLQEAF